MNVVVAGATGFVGRHLCMRLLSHGHRVTALTRRRAEAERLFGTAVKASEWDGMHPGQWEKDLQGAQAVINLAGAPIADMRWTKRRKRLLTESRINTTRALVQACSRLAVKPQIFLSASGIGFYGPQDDRALDETGPPGDGFLADLCVQWESAAKEASTYGIRVGYLRTGMVLGKEGGALPRIAFPFRFFLGGPVMPGIQWISWIHRDDLVGLIEWALETPGISGPLNAVSPGPVTMAEFCKTLSQVLNKPSWLPVPEFVLKVGLGELGSMMTTGQRVIPTKAKTGGFRFQHPVLDKALQNILMLGRPD